MKTSSQEKKDHILEVAEKLFSKYGYDGTSTRLLSQEADVNLGMLTYYFGTKQKILQALIEKKHNFYRTNLDALKPYLKSNFNMMEAVVDIYIDHMVANAKFHRIVQHQVFHSKDESTTEFMFNSIKRNCDYINTIIEDGIKAKEFRPIDAPLFVMSLIGTLLQYIRSEELTCQLLKEKGTKLSKAKDLALHKERLRNFMKDYLHTYLKAH